MYGLGCIGSIRFMAGGVRGFVLNSSLADIPALGNEVLRCFGRDSFKSCFVSLPDLNYCGLGFRV